MSGDTVESKLREHWPPQNVVLRCESCGREVYNAQRDAHREAQPPEIATEVDMFARGHRQEYGCDSFAVDIEINVVEPVEEIEVAITVTNTNE